MVSCLVVCVYVDEIGLQGFSLNWLTLRSKFSGGRAGTRENFVSVCESVWKHPWSQQCRSVLAGSSPVQRPVRDTSEGPTVVLAGGPVVQPSVLSFALQPWANGPRPNNFCLCYLTTLSGHVPFTAQVQNGSWKKEVSIQSLLNRDALPADGKGRWQNGAGDVWGLDVTVC